jgi:carbamoyltransferase
MTLTLGLHTGHESSAVLFEDDRLVAAVSDERLSRVKNDGGRLMDLSIEEVLRLTGRQRADIDRLALLYTFFPEEYVLRETWLKELERRWVRARRRANGDRPQLSLDNFAERLEARGKSFEHHFLAQRFLDGEGFRKAGLSFFDHHCAHALAAAYYSGFESCAVVTMDGSGDRNISHTSGVWRNGEYKRLHFTDVLGASPGLFYSHVTQLLGFRPLRHEGKVVGLAAMGDPDPLYASFQRALSLGADGRIFWSDFAGGQDAERRRFDFMKSAIQGHSREDVSAAAQKLTEDVGVELVRRFLRETGERKVALNGGVFANVKLNQRIAELDEVDQIFVFPAMSDTGNSVGAVLLDIAERQPGRLRHSRPLEHVYWGPAYSDEEIESSLSAARLRVTRMAEAALVERAARAMHEGLVVGWFQGRMEFGPRALGNRSMLARPTDARINDWLNQRLGRSEFMPFAPSVLAEHADEVFVNVGKARHTAEFMTITFDVRPEWRQRIPAVVHVDGTARPQLVRKAVNPLFHRVISAYHLLSGIPLLLNTSFNVHEEPIVCAPAEAVRALVEERIDSLAIGPYWAERA